MHSICLTIFVHYCLCILFNKQWIENNFIISSFKYNKYNILKSIIENNYRDKLGTKCKIVSEF